MAVASLVTGGLLHASNHVPPWGEFTVVSVIAVVAARSVADRQAVYRLRTLQDPTAHLVRLSVGPAAGALAAAGTLLLLRDHASGPSYLLVQPVAWALASTAFILAFRSIVAWRLQCLARSGRLSKRVALIGANGSSLEFIQRASRDPRIEIVGIFDDRATRLSQAATEAWLCGDVAQLVAHVRRQPIDAIVISLPLDAGDRMADMRRRLSGMAVDIYLATETALLPDAGTHLTTLGGSAVVSLSSHPLKDWAAFTKGTFDRTVSASLLLLALPLMLTIAVAVKVSSAGPILFRQEREGLNGAPFTMLKFRTMYSRPKGDEAVQATLNDRRVTRIGFWLRRFSLDELPQLWNVLRGDMSLVGPRPHLATTRAGNRLFCDVVPDYQARHRMKPGVTGWAQVHGLRGETRTEQDIKVRVAHDIHYIDHWSLGLDLRIILQTLTREIFSRSGRAY